MSDRPIAQIEAAETLISLVEAAEHCKRGLPRIPLDEPGALTKAAGQRAFLRYACKMATGTGVGTGDGSGGRRRLSLAR
ncbi:MAG: hypothetical protein EP309_10685 [Gammaproteobacteria bacterium]|jgi:type III restriction enzyme|nr:hypothetical protein [Candidatus Thioaporhodococcus sediminis]TNF51726.1 MAG: hypothetical protein EP309_10685 [Gammaproteobacteria bacterium]